MRRFVDWFNERELSEHTILLGFSVIIGLLSALGVVAFYRARSPSVRAPRPVAKDPS